MASWNTSATASNFNANEQIQNQVAGRNRQGNDFAGGVGYNTLTTTSNQYGEATNLNVDNTNYDLGDYFRREDQPLDVYGVHTTTTTDYKSDNPFRVGIETTETTTGYSIIGINGNHVPAMRAAVEEYVEAVQTYLEDAITTTEGEIKRAFRGGEAETAVYNYLEKVKSYVHNLVSTLNAFSDKLADVGNAWVQAQSNIASSVNTATGSFSEGSAYTSQVQYGGSSQGGAPTA